MVEFIFWKDFKFVWGGVFLNVLENLPDVSTGDGNPQGFPRSSAGSYSVCWSAAALLGLVDVHWIFSSPPLNMD